MNNADNLQKLSKKNILVTDIARQFWCERQMELGYMFGVVRTKAMKEGAKVHSALQDAVYKPLEVETHTYADYTYKAAYESYIGMASLIETGMCREMHIYGSLNGYRLSGKIDEIRISGGKMMVVENKTISMSAEINEAITRPHRVQTLLYWKMIEDIKKGSYGYENHAASYRIKDMRLSDEFARGLEGAGIGADLASIESIYKRMFERMRALPELDNKMEIHYIDRLTKKETGMVSLDYDAGIAEGYIKEAMSYWRGERESMPVSEEEKWKCRQCGFFGNKCTVWWKGGV
jgi:hypothetical protein